MRKSLFAALIGALALLTGNGAQSAQGSEKEPLAAETEAIMKLAQEPWTGDLGGMRERRFVRVLVSYSRTNFFITEGRPRGFEYDLFEEYEAFLNGKAKRGTRVDMVYVPVQFDDLISALTDGRGDVIAAGVTITPERAEKVDFTKPYLPEVDEIVVAHKGIKGLRNLDDLAGRNLLLVAGSSYIPHVKALSDDLVRRGHVAIGIRTAPAEFEAEDVLELVNAEIVDLTIVDNQIAEIWSGVLPEIQLYPDLIVNRDGEIAWAVRKDSPELMKSLNEFVTEHRRGSRIGNILFKRYFENTKWITNPVSPKREEVLDKYAGLFKKYAEMYNFDWQLIAAQAYQESGLDQKKRSHRGAVGLMQIRPSTAKDPNVDIHNIGNAENNIHAGVKYLAFLRDRYFSDNEIEPEARVRFALAAYNAGPGNIAKMRDRAAKAGVDENRWFDNVARTTLQYIGAEPVTYVSNINKYYFAYKLAEEKLARRKEQLEAIKQDGAGD